MYGIRNKLWGIRMIRCGYKAWVWHRMNDNIGSVDCSCKAKVRGKNAHFFTTPILLRGAEDIAGERRVDGPASQPAGFQASAEVGQCRPARRLRQMGRLTEDFRLVKPGDGDRIERCIDIPVTEPHGAVTDLAHDLMPPITLPSPGGVAVSFIDFVFPL